MSLNEKKPGDCGYVAFFKGKRFEVYAPSSLAARAIVAKHVKARKEYDVTVLIAEREDGTAVEHTATF